jgi:hypothetical protein
MEKTAMTYQIVTEPQKTMFGKRTGSVLARLESDWSSNIASAAAPNATLAKQALLNQLGRLASSDERAYIMCGDRQTVLMVSFAGTSWQYDIVGFDRAAGRSGCIMPGCTDFKAAKARAIERCGELFNDELPYAPLYQRVDYAIVSDNLRGPEQATILHPVAGGVRYWEWYLASA